MKKFLYGASVQGIQSFIFQTNELKDIVGASELVEHICTSLFEDNFGKDGEPIVSAAGNIKFVFNSREACARAVGEFPKMVMQTAPGITVSQAVVEVTDEQLANGFHEASNELERRLRIQRNRPQKSLSVGAMCVERSRKTGLPAVAVNKEGDFLDEGTASKRQTTIKEGVNVKLCKKSFGVDHLSYKQLCLDTDDMTGRNSWLAIIHADGNGLGQVVAKIGKKKEALRKFSKDLDAATIAAAQEAFQAFQAVYVIKDGERIPFRPIVLGGDDMTMLCRADFALEYTQAYLKAFEEQTKQMGHPLTACAGIALVKASYPFHYGYSLAETLCGEAKRVAKAMSAEAPSCLMFHKVQSSYVERYVDILRNEKTPQQGLSLEFGPYFLAEQQGYWTMDELLQRSKDLDGKEGNAVKTDIRQWLTLLHDSKEKAVQKADRVRQLFDNDRKMLKLFDAATTAVKRGSDSHYPAADLLTLHTILYQQTK